MKRITWKAFSFILSYIHFKMSGIHILEESISWWNSNFLESSSIGEMCMFECLISDPYHYSSQSIIYFMKSNMLSLLLKRSFIFLDHASSIESYLKREDWYMWSHMTKGTVTLPVFQSLEAFWPGLQVSAVKPLYNMIIFLQITHKDTPRPTQWPLKVGGSWGCIT